MNQEPIRALGSPMEHAGTARARTCPACWVAIENGTGACSEAARQRDARLVEAFVRIKWLSTVGGTERGIVEGFEISISRKDFIINRF